MTEYSNLCQTGDKLIKVLLQKCLIHSTYPQAPGPGLQFFIRQFLSDGVPGMMRDCRSALKR